MAKSGTPKPTDAELNILNVLWMQGPLTVKEVHEIVGDETGYTTTLKLLQNMYAKGLVRRDLHFILPSLKAGTTKYVVSVQQAAQGSAPTGTVAASTAPADPTVGAVGSPAVGK